MITLLKKLFYTGINTLGNRYVEAFLVVAMTLVVLGLKTSSHAVNFADSNDLLLAAEAMGLAHPPGYPLLILLLAGIQHCFSNISMVVISGWVSATLMGLAAGLIFLIIGDMVRRIKPSFSQDVSIIVPVLLWLTTPLNWVLGTVIEVMPFGIVLILLGTFFCVRKMYGWAAFFSVLASLHHPLLLLLTGSVWVYSLLLTRFQTKRLIRMGLGAGAALLFVVISYWTVAHAAPKYSWEIPQSLSEWWQMFTRQTYTESGSAIEMFNQGANISVGMESIGLWTKWWLWDQWGWLMGIFCVVGIGSLIYLRQRKWLGIIVGLLMVYGPGVAFYVKHPATFRLTETAIWWGTALRERMFYIFLLLLPFLAFLGVYVLLKPLQKRVWVQWAILFILLIVCGWRVGGQFSQGSMDTGANATAVYSEQVLTSLPEKAILVAQTDEVFNFLYAQLALHIREDVSVVPVGMVLEPIKWRSSNLTTKGFTDNQQAYVVDIVTTALRQQRPVYLYAVDAEILSYLGLEGNPFYGVPEGLLLRVVMAPPTLLPDADYGISVQLAPIKTRADNWFKGFRAHLATLHTQQTYYLARLGFKDQAEWHATIAKNLFYESASRQIVDSTLQVGWARFKTEQSYWGYKPLMVEEWQQRATTASRERKYDEAAYFSSRAALLRAALGR